ncbi:TonB-dependent receptor domain-containing protein, partial [Steroidobacter sp.]|uniref:TonB-dependent receptor domain-containing protein n=1 Tax=Steroidobacter sp. TaxID=1978227 RepID=UPI001A5471FB
NCNQPIAAILDTRNSNLSSVKTRGVDADIDYAFDTAIGEIGLGLRGTYTLDYVTQLTDTAPAYEVVDTLNHPLSLRVAGTVSWARQDWKAYATVNYAGGYRISSTAQLGSIGSWTTVDLNLGYQVTSDNAWFSGTRVYLGAINLFDREPPFVNVAGVFAYDGANATLLGRQLSLQIIKQW